IMGSWPSYIPRTTVARRDVPPTRGFRMIRSLWRPFYCIVLAIGIAPAWGLAQENGGQEDLDKALQAKVTAQSLRDLNEVIQLLESAIEKGLDVESSDFAETLLVESLLERAAQLTAVV